MRELTQGIAHSRARWAQEPTQARSTKGRINTRMDRGGQARRAREARATAVGATRSMFEHASRFPSAYTNRSEWQSSAQPQQGQRQLVQTLQWECAIQPSWRRMQTGAATQGYRG